MRISAGSKILVCVMGVAMGACAFTNAKVVDDILLETPRGAVFLKNAEDGWFRTAHPFDLSSEVLTTVFRGVHVQLSATDAAPESRVFSDEDTEFLGPLMRTALSKATSRQVVGFRVVHALDGREETTGGILYVQGRLLHLTLSHYRARQDSSEPGDTTHHLTPNPMELDKHQITFTPESARRSSRHEQPDVIDSPPLASLVLDYETLIKGMTHPPTSLHARPIRQEKASILQQIIAPAFPTSGAPVSHRRQPPPENVSNTVQVLGSEKDTELEALKEEVRTLRRRLSDLEETTQRTKRP